MGFEACIFILTMNEPGLYIFQKAQTMNFPTTLKDFKLRNPKKKKKIKSLSVIKVTNN